MCDGGAWRILRTSYLEYGAHLTEVLSGAQKPESQNWTHMFGDGIEMGNETVRNLSNKHKTRDTITIRVNETPNKRNSSNCATDMIPQIKQCRSDVFVLFFHTHH